VILPRSFWAGLLCFSFMLRFYNSGSRRILWEFSVTPSSLELAVAKVRFRCKKYFLMIQ
jgi:hypothetical protein